MNARSMGVEGEEWLARFGDRTLRRQYRREIIEAIADIKRTELGRWFRKRAREESTKWCADDCHACKRRRTNTLRAEGRTPRWDDQ